MRTVVLDTNAYVAFARGDEEAKTIIQAAPRLLIPFVVQAELFAGFRMGRREAENRQHYAEFLALPGIDVQDSSANICDHYAAIVSELRKRGRPIPTNDIWVAAVTRDCGGALYSLDAHFQNVPGLLVGQKKANLLL